VAVISISIPDEMLQLMDEIVEMEGYTSRSELIRSLLRDYLRERARVRRRSKAALVIVLTDHDESLSVDQKVVEIIHKYQVLVKAFYHQLLEDNLCLNIAVLNPSPSVAEVLKVLKRLRGVKSVWRIDVPAPEGRGEEGRLV